MATYYVSNAAQNTGSGWANGSDLNNGTSKATPFATIAKATSVMTDADTTIINPTNIPYSEDSGVLGSGYLNWALGTPITGDPALAGTGVNPSVVPIIRAASSASRVINGGGTAYLQTLACVTIDCQLGGSRVAFAPHVSSGGFTFRQVNFINCASGVFGNWTAGTTTVTLDRVTVDSSNTATTLFQFGGMDSLSVLGGRFTSAATSDKNPRFYFNANTLTNVTFAADTNGVIPYFGGTTATIGAGNYNQVVNGGTGYTVSDVLTMVGGTSTQSAQVTVTAVSSGVITAVSITRQGNYSVVPDMSAGGATFTGGTGTGARIVLFTNDLPAISVNASSTITNFTCAATFDRVPSAVRFDGTVTNWIIQDSTITYNLAFRTFAMVGFTCTTGRFRRNNWIGYNTVGTMMSENAQGCTTNNNTFRNTIGGRRVGNWYRVLGSGCTSTQDSYTIDAGAFGGVFCGSDGAITDASNFDSSRTGFLAVADNSSRKYVSTSWTTQVLNSSGRATHLYSVDIEIQKVGTGQNMTCSLFTNNAGAPGTLVGTSDVLLASAVTGYSFYSFYFSTPLAITANTKYHLVFSTTGPTVSASNYMNLTLSGNVQTPGPGKIDYVQYSSNASSWSADLTHAFEIFINCGWFGYTPVEIAPTVVYASSTDPLEVEAFNFGPTLNPTCIRGTFINAGYVLTKDSIGGLFASNFMLVSPGKTSSTGLYAKASANVKFLNNTILVPSGFGITVGPDSLFTANHISSTGFIAKNNLICCIPGGSGPAYPYAISSDSNVSLIDSNSVYLNGQTTVNYDTSATQAVWQGLSRDVNSIFSDPLLTNQTVSARTVADITPRLSSPVIGRGLDLRSLAPTDISGNPFTSKPSMGAVEYLSGELLAIVSGATTVYAIVRNKNGLVWNGSMFETYTTANLATYAQGFGQQGSTGVWSGSMPLQSGARPPRGRYYIDYRIQIGGAPAETDTIISRGKLVVDWDGSAEINPVDPAMIVPPPL